MSDALLSRVQLLIKQSSTYKIEGNAIFHIFLFQLDCMLHFLLSVLLSSITFVTIIKRKPNTCKKITGDAHTLGRNINMQSPVLVLQLLLSDRIAYWVIFQEPETCV
jgi:hypothetical protein